MKMARFPDSFTNAQILGENYHGSDFVLFFLAIVLGIVFISINVFVRLEP